MVPINFIFSAQDQSCEACFNTRICVTTAGWYLNSTILFDKSLLSGPCKLLLNGTITNVTIMEQSNVEVFPNSNYSIWCPLCLGGINYAISYNTFTDVEDCSNVGMYLYIYTYAYISFTIMMY